MSTIQALILGIIQGITEFFPISSSGHLKIAESLLGLENLQQYILFDLVCHLGTLLAIVLVLSIELRRLVKEDHTRLFQVIIATLPLFLLIPLMEPVKSLFGQPEYLGIFFLLTAIILKVGLRFKVIKQPRQRHQDRWRDALVIGFFQLLAILPGISRSGSTISAAWMRGWDRRDAVVFSFLIAIPAIVGGSTIEVFQIYLEGPQEAGIGSFQYLAGFASSFTIGYGALLLLIRLAVKEQFQYFVWYCLLLGLWALWYFRG